jgi:hypothetical protein
MLAALEREPQVGITLNLAPQLCPGGIFIPERIIVDCYLCDLTTEFPTISPESDATGHLSAVGRNKVRFNLGRVLELTAVGCRGLPASGNDEEHRGASLAPKHLFNVPEDLNGEFDVMLSTGITVFNSIALDEYESGLTCPRILYDMGKLCSGKGLEFEYHLGDEPGFKYRSF